VQERLATLGFETTTATPEELAAFFKSDMSKWANVIRVAGIKAN
jgi:tripartite-type tricarboxylate transporter receptor subunit TctC